MKKIFYSFIACFTCLIFFLSPCYGYAITDELIDVLNNTIYSRNIYDTQEIVQKVLNKIFLNQLQSPTNNNGSLEITAPTFDYITGKVQLHYDIYDRLTNEITNSDDVLVESTFILSPNSDPYIDEDIDVPLFGNGINITITRTSVSPQHYFIRFPSTFNYSRHITFANDSIIISAQNNCNVYKVDKGASYSQIFGNVSYSNFYVGQTTFKTNSVNDITVSVNEETALSGSDLNTYSPNPDGIYSNQGNNVSGSNRLNYPTTVDILHGSFTVAYPRLDGSASYYRGKTFNCFAYFSTGFVVTNNSTHSLQVTSNYTDVYEQNYYIYPITGGTTITENNYNEYNLPSVAPIFDLDPSLPTFDTDLLELLPTILNALDTDLLPDLVDLLARIMGFFEHMPDIGMTWNPDTSLNTNNYWELDFPSDDSGGGGSGGDITVYVTVDITRPLITTYPYSDPLEIASLPQITTYTMPVSVQDSAKSILDTGEDVLQDSGLIPIYAFLTLIGIGVAIIFKGV